MRFLFTVFILPVLIYASPAMAQNHVTVTKPGTDLTAVSKDRPSITAKDSQNRPSALNAGGAGQERSSAIIKRDYYFFSDYGLSVGAHLLAQGQYSDAISTFKDVLERNPRNIDALAGIGAGYLALKQLKPAGDYIRKTLARDNKHIGANYLYGRYFIQSGEITQAVDQLHVLNMLCGAKYKCIEAIALQGEINDAQK